MPAYLARMRPSYRILGGLLAVAIFMSLFGCQKAAVDDKGLIRQRLQQMVTAVENRQATGFLEGIHKDFLGQGTLHKANLAGLLLLQFRQHAVISVRLSDVEIQLDSEQRATTTLVAQVSGQGGWLGTGRNLHIQSRWQKVENDWQVERARWQTVP